jgi:hypothetical protein
MKHLWILAVFLILALLTACGGPAAPAASPQATVEVQETLAAPDPDKTTVIGRVVNITSGQPLADTIVRLAEIVRQGGEGAFILDVGFSPGAITDAQGYFAMENISVKEYLVVVGNVETDYEIIIHPDGSAKTFETEGGSIIDLGQIETKLGQ